MVVMRKEMNVLRNEWKEAGGDRFKKKVTPNSNLTMMSVVGMNLHEE